MHYADGSSDEVIADASWKNTYGHILKNSLHLIEGLETPSFRWE
ncbi:hypothetical protein [Catalinimonas locisalis]